MKCFPVNIQFGLKTLAQDSKVKPYEETDEVDHHCQGMANQEKCW